MNAPVRPFAPTGSIELREFIGEMLELAQIQAKLGATYAAIGDDIGLNYTTRKLAAYVQVAVATLRDINDKRTTDAR